MVVQMKEVARTTTTRKRPATINPVWMPRRMPRWMTLSHATHMLQRKDAKNLGERAKRLHVSIRRHPYDGRKRLVLMPELLSRLDYDASVIKFSDGVDWVEPHSSDTRKAGTSR